MPTYTLEENKYYTKYVLTFWVFGSHKKAQLILYRYMVGRKIEETSLRW